MYRLKVNYHVHACFYFILFLLSLNSFTFLSISVVVKVSFKLLRNPVDDPCFEPWVVTVKFFAIRQLYMPPKCQSYSGIWDFEFEFGWHLYRQQFSASNVRNTIDMLYSRANIINYEQASNELANKALNLFISVTCHVLLAVDGLRLRPVLNI